MGKGPTKVVHTQPVPANDRQGGRLPTGSIPVPSIIFGRCAKACRRALSLDLATAPAYSCRPSYLQTALKNSSVAPVAEIVACSSRWPLITEPSEPKSRTSRMNVSVPFLRLPLAPSQKVK